MYVWIFFPPNIRFRVESRFFLSPHPPPPPPQKKNLGQSYHMDLFYQMDFKVTAKHIKMGHDNELL
jgi:hypothetical protein